MSQSSNHLRLVSWTWQWVHFTQMASTVTRSPIDPIEHLWDVVEREIHIMVMLLSCQYGPKSLRNVSNTFLNLCHEELRQFWRKKGVQPGTSEVYPKKWPVSVCVCVCIYIYIYIYSHGQKYRYLGKYDQRRLWKLICSINPFDLLLKKINKI